VIIEVYQEEKKKTIPILEFISYRSNRERYPDISAERWEKIYSNAKRYEEMYQKERKKNGKNCWGTIA
jgi:hypothetical protein